MSASRSFRALLLAELRIQFREYMTWVWLLVGALLVGGGVAWIASDGATGLLGGDDSAEVDEPLPEPRWQVEGELPDWASEVVSPIVSTEPNLTVVVTPGDRTVLTIEGEDRALVDEAIRSLNARGRVERNQHLERLGLPVQGELVDARIEDDGEDELFSALTGGLTLSTATALLLYLTIASMLVESLPRSRDTGYLSTLLTLDVSRAAMLGAWAVASIVWGLLAVLAMALGWNLAASLVPSPLERVSLGLLALPAVAAVSASTTLRLVVMARDLRAASARLGIAPLVAMALFFAAAQVEAWWGPFAGSLVPIGGLGLVLSHPTLAGVIGASTASLFTSWALFAWTASLLDNADEGDQQASPVVRRRARGDWLPEVLLLAAIGLTGSAAWGGTLTEKLGQPAVGIVILLVFFYALPAVLAPRLWGLPVRELLSLSRPPPRGTWLAPFVALLTIPLGNLSFLGLRALLGNRGQSIEVVSDSLLELATSPGGVLAMSLGPGLCEELVFRGALLGLLRKRFTDVQAVLLQAGLFALVHGHPMRLPPTFLVGVVAGWLTVRTRSLWPAILLHAAHNGLSLLLADPSAPEPALDATFALTALGMSMLGALAAYGVVRLSGSSART